MTNRSTTPKWTKKRKSHIRRINLFQPGQVQPDLPPIRLISQLTRVSFQVKCLQRENGPDLVHERMQVGNLIVAHLVVKPDINTPKANNK
jgi:hypothetical protein